MNKQTRILIKSFYFKELTLNIFILLAHWSGLNQLNCLDWNLGIPQWSLKWLIVVVNFLQSKNNFLLIMNRYIINNFLPRLILVLKKMCTLNKKSKLTFNQILYGVWIALLTDYTSDKFYNFNEFEYIQFFYNLIVFKIFHEFYQIITVLVSYCFSLYNFLHFFFS